MPDAAGSRGQTPAGATNTGVPREKIRAAAALLKPARRLLVAGLGGVSTEAQRLAVAIADRRGGVADWTASAGDASPLLALQATGAATATFGEVVERADLVVRWRCEASEQVPGLAQEPAVVSIPGDETPLAPGADYEAISVLRALAKAIEPDAAAVEQQTGVGPAAWRSLLQKFLAARTVAFLLGSSTREAGAATVSALTLLAQDLADRVRVYIVQPMADDNRSGAENVLAWQTGCPMAVDFGRGYPRYLPGEAEAATLLERGEADAALLLGSAFAAQIPTAARDHLATIPNVLLSAGEPEAATVCFQVAPLHQSGGTYYRTDGVALRNAEPTGDRPTAATVLAALLAEFRDG